MRGTRSVAAFVMNALHPRRLEVTAGGRALLVDGATDRNPDAAFESDATRRLAIGAAHRDEVFRYRHRQFGRHQALGCGVGFEPVKGCAEKGAARAAGQTRIRHTRRNGTCHSGKRCGIVRGSALPGKSPLERLPAANSASPARTSIRHVPGSKRPPDRGEIGP
jgi:hypothetical protein